MRGGIDPDISTWLTLTHFNRTAGEIYRLRFPGGKTLVNVSTNKLVNELCDETRFRKSIKNALIEVRYGVHDGLFTADEGEENWGIAHRVLMPAFGPVSVRGMFDPMYDLGTQLALKWARHGPSHAIAVTEDFTRLALDTIALCSMDFRFNSFYSENLHPFIAAMSGFLVESGIRFRRPGFAKIFFRAAQKQFDSDIELMRETSRDVIKARRANPDHKGKDLLSAMLDATDPVSGQKMSDESIIDNLITFLVAGHETTSGTLSFAFYNLLKNPEAYQKAQQEVDEIFGREPITVDKLFKMQYIPGVSHTTCRYPEYLLQVSPRLYLKTVCSVP